jgi:hypothetical protein
MKSTCVPWFALAILFVVPFFVFAQAVETGSPTPVSLTSPRKRESWTHFAGESPDRFLIETMGGGVAFLDFDGDGLQDILFVNGGETPHGKSQVPVRNALYHNLGNGKFEEVAAKAENGPSRFLRHGCSGGGF